jgi:hypothetical protein
MNLAGVLDFLSRIDSIVLGLLSWPVLLIGFIGMSLAIFGKTFEEGQNAEASNLVWRIGRRRITTTGWAALLALVTAFGLGVFQKYSMLQDESDQVSQIYQEMATKDQDHWRSVSYLHLLQEKLDRLPGHATRSPCPFPGLSPDVLWNFDGSIGKEPARMTLQVNGQNVVGVLVYANHMKQEVQVSGSIAERKQIVLDELDATGKASATFRGGFFAEKSQLCGAIGNAIVGLLQDKSAAHATPFHLIMSDTIEGKLPQRYSALPGAVSDELINQRVWQFWDAVRRNDRRAIESLVAYPVTMNGLKVRDPSEFDAHYESVFSPRFREAISDILPRNLGSMHGAIYAKGGLIWFNAEGKATQLNTGVADVVIRGHADIVEAEPPAM